jgi:hypothetical protein
LRGETGDDGAIRECTIQHELNAFLIFYRLKQDGNLIVEMTIIIGSSCNESISIQVFRPMEKKMLKMGGGR